MYVRGEHSSEGKSELSTFRSVPMADRLARELDRWSRRAVYCTDEDVVFAHPHTGKPLDRSKVTKRFKAACVAAGVRPVRFHDLRHTFGTRLAAAGQPICSIQEFLGHADSKRSEATGNKTGNKLSKTGANSKTETAANNDFHD